MKPEPPNQPEPSALLSPEGVANRIARTFDMLGTGDPRVETKAVELIAAIVEQTKGQNLVAQKKANQKNRDLGAELTALRRDKERLDWLERKAYTGCSSLRLESDNDNQVQWWTAFDGRNWHEERTARAAIDAASAPKQAREKETP